MAVSSNLPSSADVLRTFRVDQAASLTPLLCALWHEAQGNWRKAHEIAQDIQGPDASWVHAYLHRREGDIGNAGYWYRRAGKPTETGPLQAEWTAIVTALLAQERVS